MCHPLVAAQYLDKKLAISSGKRKLIPSEEFEMVATIVSPLVSAAIAESIGLTAQPRFRFVFCFLVEEQSYDNIWGSLGFITSRVHTHSTPLW
jgi:hypothetical protein